MKIKEIVVENFIAIGDSFDIELDNVLIETKIIGFVPGGVVVDSDSAVLQYFKKRDMLDMSTVINESRMAEVDMIFNDLATGARGITDVLNNPQTAEERYASSQLQDMFDEVVMDYDLDPRVDYEKVIDELSNRISDEYAETDSDEQIKINPPIVNEAEYQGRKVPLGKPMRGDVKKFKVFVKNPKGNVVKVNFGDPNMRIKKSNPARRKSFRARHRCATAKDRTTARYWSCRKW
jgi:hypothetical protein